MKSSENADTYVHDGMTSGSDNVAYYAGWQCFLIASQGPRSNPERIERKLSIILLYSVLRIWHLYIRSSML